MAGLKQWINEPIELPRSIPKASSVNILDRKGYFVRFFMRIKTILAVVARYTNIEEMNARCKGLYIIRLQDVK